MEVVRSEKKKTLIVGATENPSRYAFMAASMFEERGMDFVPIGIKKGSVYGRDILDLRQKPALEGIHTITLYIGPANQEEWIDYLIGLKPQRIIFNPGTENPVFFRKAKEAGIEVLPACNLVMLSTGQF
ncbi:MAG: CoA-binding protein [Cytophagales bacterium]|uniref:CoA-binding protein n=1 Tax=Algoriphagus taiwanensis TaxID=1445656 RepID=A0ABQ6Q4M3_9BACT|nr:MAG: CoA-binding protein [Cytophagales bacterium]GMQ35028.1 CoA-binding protein [Algoriphagus taiwanensis]